LSVADGLRPNEKLRITNRLMQGAKSQTERHQWSI